MLLHTYGDIHQDQAFLERLRQKVLIDCFAEAIQSLDWLLQNLRCLRHSKRPILSSAFPFVGSVELLDLSP